MITVAIDSDLALLLLPQAVQTRIDDAEKGGCLHTLRAAKTLGLRLKARDGSTKTCGPWRR